VSPINKYVETLLSILVLAVALVTEIYLIYKYPSGGLGAIENRDILDKYITVQRNLINSSLETDYILVENSSKYLIYITFDGEYPEDAYIYPVIVGDRMGVMVCIRREVSQQ